MQFRTICIYTIELESKPNGLPWQRFASLSWRDEIIFLNTA